MCACAVSYFKRLITKRYFRHALQAPKGGHFIHALKKKLSGVFIYEILISYMKSDNRKWVEIYISSPEFD